MADLIPPMPESPPRIPTEADGKPSLTALMTGIVDDLQRLIRQEMQLARREVQQEWEKAKIAAGAFAAAAFLGALAALMFCFFFVYLLSWATGLPLWCWFIIAFGILGAAALILFAVGRTKAQEINVVPPQTAQTMRENVEWIQNQT
jgi:uncharacterized membrane protein YgcG